MEQEKPSVTVAALMTLTALLGLGAAILMPGGNPSASQLNGVVACALGIIALAIAAWVNYFREYIAYEIERAVEGKTADA